MRRFTIAWGLVAALAFTGCVSTGQVVPANGRTVIGRDAQAEAAVGRKLDAFGPQPESNNILANPPVGLQVALGRGEVTPAAERSERPAPVATPTGTVPPATPPTNEAAAETGVAP